MTNIRFRRGARLDVPASAPSGMPLWCEDTKEFYIGTGTGIRLINQTDADTVDGCHAGNEANNVLKLDSTGKVPLINMPASDAIPAGTVSFFTKNTPPTGYLKCNGAAVSRTTYLNLFNTIGTTFGAGDGSTTFNLPDLRGEFIRGWDDGRGIDVSRVFGSWQIDELRSHRHTYYMPNAPTDNDGGGSQVAVEGRTSSNTGYAGGVETRPRNYALLPCIKY